jgi:hypothetical protein
VATVGYECGWDGENKCRVTVVWNPLTTLIRLQDNIIMMYLRGTGCFGGRWLETGSGYVRMFKNSFAYCYN